LVEAISAARALVSVTTSARAPLAKASITIGSQAGLIRFRDPGIDMGISWSGAVPRGGGHRSWIGSFDGSSIARRRSPS
jgi:hypothetical protein